MASHKHAANTNALTSTFLLPNLHCNTCVSATEQAVSSLHPPPISFSHSIVSHTFTVTHPSTLSVVEIAKALEDAGFEVYNEEYVSGSIGDILQQAINRWRPKRAQDVDATKLQIHRENCEACRQAADNYDGTRESHFGEKCAPPSPDIRELAPEDLEEGQSGDIAPLNVVISNTSAPKYDRFQAQIQVTGMTCASCVSSITNALKEQAGIENVNVNLLTNTANVIFNTVIKQEDIVESVEDIGFEAELVSVTPLFEKQPDNTQPVAQTKKLMIRVDGMYCMHCPIRVEKGMQSLEGVSIEKLPSIDDPFLTVTYTPNGPCVTARSILQAINDQDAALKPSIHKPPTLEQRSQGLYRREQRHLLYRLTLSMLCAVPSFIIGIVYMNLLPDANSGRHYFEQSLGGAQRGDWAMFILATPVYFIAASLFHVKTAREIRALWRPKSPVPVLRRFIRFGSMNMLISLGTSIAYWASLAQVILSTKRPGNFSNGGTQTYFDSVVFLTLFLLAGRLIEAFSKAKTGDSVTALGHLRPQKSLLVVRSGTREVDTELIDIGDIARILPGGSPPYDGVVTSGQSRFDESALTGESRLVSKSKGDEVFSGTINKDSAINLRVTSLPGQSMLDEIVTAVQEGQTKRAPIERTADLLTSYFVPLITLLAIVTWIIWLSLGVSGSLPQDYLDVDQGGWPYWALEFAIAVFIVACPCGLGLAAPTALFAGIGLAAQHGILVKGGGEAFQEASGIDVVAFDKTGTLTNGGDPEVVDAFLESENDAVTLSLIAKLEEDSNHPITKALEKYVRRSQHVDPISMQSTQEVQGKGMTGIFTMDPLHRRSVQILVGNESLMTDNNVELSKSQQERLEEWKQAGNSVALAAARDISDNTPEATNTFTLVASFAIADPIRPEAQTVIAGLQNRNIAVWMVTGDNATTAQAVAAKVGISPTNIIAGVLPTGKSDKIKYLQQSQPSRTKGRASVAMVGDGINDAPALATADVGIALASGTDVAVQTAPFVILNPSNSASLDLTTVLTLFSLSRKVFHRVYFNFGWALAYNAILLPIAAGVLYPVKNGGSHVRLDPAFAALAMALSSISVVVSSLSLRWGWLPGVGFRAEKKGD